LDIFGGFAIFIKLLADVVSESVSENFFRTSELIKNLVQETRREVRRQAPPIPGSTVD
jgi:predicted transcriptional regulator